jgi:hypothetical protein
MIASTISDAEGQTENGTEMPLVAAAFDVSFSSDVRDWLADGGSNATVAVFG